MQDRPDSQPIPFPLDRTRRPGDTPERRVEQQASQKTLGDLFDEMSSLIKTTEDGVSEQDTMHNRNRGIMVDYNPVSGDLEYRIVTRQADPNNHLRFTERHDIVTMHHDPQADAFVATLWSSYTPGEHLQIQKPGAEPGQKVWAERMDIEAKKDIVDPVMTEAVCQDHMRIARAEVNLRANEQRAHITLAEEPRAAEN